MVDFKGGVFGSFFWVSLVVLMVFVVSIQLVFYVFDVLCLVEKVWVQVLLDLDLEINVWFWEDLFVVLCCYELECFECCECQCKVVQVFDGDCGKDMLWLCDFCVLLVCLDVDQNCKIDDIFIIFVLMLGVDFVGVEEVWWCICYVMLVGLLVQDYVFDNVECLSLLEFNLLDGSSGVGGGYMVFYELLLLCCLSIDELLLCYVQIVLLWVDEMVLLLCKFDVVVCLIDQLMGDKV